MSKGVLSYWNSEKCFGFIRDDDGAPDAFAAVKDMAGVNP